MGNKGGFSSSVHEETTRVIETKSERVTAPAEQMHREGKGLHITVDPRTHGGYREAVNLMMAKENLWLLPRGIAMPVKNDFDGTGSMHGNIALAFKALPRSQKLLIALGLLGRYHGQFSSGVIQDDSDCYPYQTSEFESDNRMADQMRYLMAEAQGGDAPEEYQYSLWYMANRIKSTIWEYGLKGYYFITGDEIGRDSLNGSSYGFKKAFGSIDGVQSISVENLGKDVLKKWHAFFLQVDRDESVTDYWQKVLGSERVIILPRTEFLPEIQAAVTGLTEGILELQTLEDYLVETAKVSSMYAQKICNAVSNIPVRAQAKLPNFNKIPLAGSIFAKATDLYPMDWENKEQINPTNLRIKL